MSVKKKLIEVAIPLSVINENGYREQTIKRGKPTQMHKWWAGRPLTVARAVLWASLIDDPSSDPSLTPKEQEFERQRLFRILEALSSWDNSNDSATLDAAREELHRCYPNGLPSVLDPFGGGGAIPLEAQRLGLPTLSGDLNPVAVILQKAMMDIPPRFSNATPVSAATRQQRSEWHGNEGLAADVEAYGEWMQRELENRIGHLYRDESVSSVQGRIPIAWIWARTIQSPDPSWNSKVPLVTTWWLSKGKGTKSVWIEPLVDRQSRTIAYQIRTGGAPVHEPTISRAVGRCLATGATITNDYIVQESKAGRLGVELIAIVAKQKGSRGRVFLQPTSSEFHESAALESDAVGPEGKLPEAGLGFRIQKYGFQQWMDLFNPRQLSCMLTLSDLLNELELLVRTDALEAGMSADQKPLSKGGTGAHAYAQAVRTYMAFAVNRVAVWNNVLCAWDSTNVVNQQLFSRQTVPMIWDHCEIRPFDSAAGSLSNSVETIASSIRVLPTRVEAVRVRQMDAREHVRDAECVVVSTDPPYYDNIGYADLSDFFYVWIRHNLGDVFPEECATLLTPKGDELIADSSRHGGSEGGKVFFESGMSEFMSAMRKSMDSSAPATLYYAYKAVDAQSEGGGSTGWATFLQAVVDAKLRITATWPIRTENPSRLRAIGSNAMTVSVVLVCRPRETGANKATRAEFVAALREELPAAIKVMQSGNVAPVDIPQSTIGPGIGIFSEYAQVIESDGSEMSVAVALAIINDVLGEILDGDASEMDADSRFALTWYSQFGFNPASSGDADAMARAKNTSVAGVVEAGVGEARAGKFRLFDRSELALGWSPLTDKRPTVWEATQHLIAALDRSESEAAELLRQLGDYADRARVLAYLLFKKATDKGWADEAGAYNGLIMAWPTLQSAGVSTTQQSMELG